LRGKAAFITGAGSGIGRATARRFAEEGAAVMVADVVADRAAETAQMLSDDGLQARSACVDVTDAGAVEDALALTQEELGGLDVVVNNAGTTIVGAVQERFVYLASDEARWVTGAALVLDGGLTSGIWSGGNGS
jgi:NAD(P)-dependent dehydrogenase (short-subunit alcohol dehydrogenase family)